MGRTTSLHQTTKLDHNRDDILALPLSRTRCRPKGATGPAPTLPSSASRSQLSGWKAPARVWDWVIRLFCAWLRWQNCNCCVSPRMATTASRCVRFSEAIDQILPLPPLPSPALAVHDSKAPSIRIVYAPTFKNPASRPCEIVDLSPLELTGIEFISVGNGDDNAGLGWRGADRSVPRSPHSRSPHARSSLTLEGVKLGGSARHAPFWKTYCRQAYQAGQHNG